MSEYLTALESNLKANNGKIMARQQGETADSENLVYYAVAIDVLTILGKDVTNFGGYNIKQAFETFAQTNKTVSNPYLYRCIVEACKTIGNDELAKTLIDQMSKSYKVGSGLDNWGYSCDNTSVYVATVAPYKAYYQTNYNDALKLIAGYKKIKAIVIKQNLKKMPTQLQWLLWLIPQQEILTRLMRLISFSKILKARTTTVYLWLPIGIQVL